MKKVYQKLVRDLIPGIITADGFTPVTRTLSGDDYRRALREKLEEELNELRLHTVCVSPNSLGMHAESADVFEVLRAMTEEYGHPELDITHWVQSSRFAFDDHYRTKRFYILELAVTKLLSTDISRVDYTALNTCAVALAGLLGTVHVSPEEILSEAARKREARGGFAKKIFLEEVCESKETSAV